MEINTSQVTGHLILITAPSGSGKGSLISHLLDVFPELVFSVSATTRKKRAGEQEGVNYYYLTEDEFQTRVDNDEFIEWAEFGGHRYGTLKSEVIGPLTAGKVMLLEIERQGADALEAILPKESLTRVYVDGGSWEELATRIQNREPIPDELLKKRHERFLEESAAKDRADHVVSNRDGELESAKAVITNIVKDILKS